MEAKQIIYATLIIGVMTTLLVAFMYDMKSEYSVSIPANNTQEQEIFDLMSANVNESYSLSQEMASKVESSEGITPIESVIMAGTSIVQAIKLLLSPIYIYMILLAKISVLFGLPSWLFPTLITFIIVAIIFVIIKAIMRYDV